MALLISLIFVKLQILYIHIPFLSCILSVLHDITVWYISYKAYIPWILFCLYLHLGNGCFLIFPVDTRVYHKTSLHSSKSSTTNTLYYFEIVDSTHRLHGYFAGTGVDRQYDCPIAGKAAMKNIQ